MSKPLKIVSLVLVVVVVIGLVTGIAVFSESYEPAPAKAGLQVDKTLMEDPGAMLTINGNEVSYADYRYFYLQNMNMYKMFFGEDYFKTDYDGANAHDLKEWTTEYITQMYALEEYAAANGIALTDEEKAEIQKDLDDLKAEHGDKFAAYLRQENYTDEAQYLRLTEQQQLAQKAEEAVQAEVEAELAATLAETPAEEAEAADGEEAAADDKEAAADGEETAADDKEAAADDKEAAADDKEAAADEEEAAVDGEEAAVDGEEAAVDGEEAAVDEEEAAADDGSMITAKHILLSFSEDAADAAADEKDVLERITALHDEIVASDDPEATFDDRMVEFSEDPGLDSYPDGYTFGEGEMVDAFYEGAKALKVGEISEPIRTDYGYHLIMRMPLDESAAAGEEEAPTAEDLAAEALENRLSEMADAMDVQEGEYYSYISPTNVK